MSVETLILLALFVALPLIQRLIEAARQRNQGPPRPAERPSPATPRPIVRTRQAPELAVPPLPDTTPHAAADTMSAGGRMTAPNTGARVTRAVTPHRTMRRHTAAGLRTGHELRRAIVLAAILGPCRANNPYDGSEHAGRP